VVTGQIIRLNYDGSTDFNHTFNDFRPNLLLLQPDGKMIVVGTPVAISDTPGLNLSIVRLDSKGNSESTFPTISESGYGISEIVSLSDGTHLAIVQAGDNVISFIGHLNADFSLDSSFQTTPAQEFALQADGKIVISGSINQRDGLSRLNSDGTVDASFQTDFSFPSTGNTNLDSGLVIEPDGGILVFAPNATITRVNNALSTQTLSVANDSTVQWLRSGTAPEIESASFDLSLNHGRTWVSLGNAIRIQGGWELDGVTVPAGGLLRAEGITATPLNDGSIAEVEQYHFVPAVGAQ
jgi:hypothetical protein